MSENKKAEAASNPGKIAALLFFALAGVNLAGNGFGAYLVYKATIGYTNPVETEAQAEAQVNSTTDAENSGPVIYTMDPFIVNLAGSPTRAIRMAVSLEMLDQRGFEEVMALGARSRDMIVRILNQKTFSDIETLQGKLFLKDQIALAINKSLKTGVVKDVYFTDLVVE